MSRGPNFIEREVFEDALAKVRRRDGGYYQDKATIYGDMSRLVIALLATTSQEDLQRIYGAGGWQGKVTFRAMRETATEFMREHHPSRLGNE